MMVVRVVVVRKMMEKNKEEKDLSRKPLQETCASQSSSGFPPLEPAPARAHQACSRSFPAAEEVHKWEPTLGNSSSKNCFPSILLQFCFIYDLAVSRWSHFSSELLERGALQLCSRLWLIYGLCALGSRPVPLPISEAGGMEHRLPCSLSLPFGDGVIGAGSSPG